MAGGTLIETSLANQLAISIASITYFQEKFPFFAFANVRSYLGELTGYFHSFHFQY